MIRKSLILLLLVQFSILAQEDKSQNVELPDFVITGTQKITLPILKKKRPKPVSTLSEEFFLPTYTGEQISLMNFDNPLKTKMIYSQRESGYDGKLTIKSGRYVLPYGEFLLDKNFKYVLLHTRVFGSNEKEYVKYAGYNVSGAEAALTFFVNKNSRVLPGLKILTAVNAYRDSYKLFGSASPSFLRKTNGIKADVNLSYKLPKDINFKVGASYRQLTSDELSLDEKIYTGDFDLSYDFSKAGVSVEGEVQRLNLFRTGFKFVEKNYYNAKALVKLKPSKLFSAKFGTVLSVYDSNTFILPTASIQFVVDDNLYLLGEYTPYTEFLKLNNFIRANRYVDFGSDIYKYVEHSSFFKIAFKYEHNKIFETAAGLYLESTKDMPYFEDRVKKGIFNIYTVPDAQKTSLFVDALFHPNYWGSFYAKLQLNDVRNSAGNVIPYNPLVDISGSYAYNFKYGIYAAVNFYYYSQIYTDLSNKNKLDDYINLSLNFKYKLLSTLTLTLDFENILNRYHFLFNRYLEKPFDIAAGVEYRW